MASSPCGMTSSAEGTPRVRGVVFVLAGALAAVACATPLPEAESPVQSAADRSARDTTRARVVNQMPFTVHVYLWGGGTETSLGTITSFQSETYRIDHLIGPGREVRFRGNPIGSSEVFLSSGLRDLRAARRDGGVDDPATLMSSAGEELR